MWCYKFPVIIELKYFVLGLAILICYFFFPNVSLFGNLNWSFFFVCLFLFWKGEIEYHIHMGDPSISIFGENTPQDG